jgi:hypothetical protein
MTPMPSGRIRASDADRDRVAAALQEHYAAGRLSAEEFDQRVDAAMAARTLDELDRLLADLPHVDTRQYQLPDATLRRPPSTGALPATGLPGPGRSGDRNDGAA